MRRTPQCPTLWLLSFALPCAFMLRGMSALVRAAGISAPQMLRATSRYEEWRRIDRRLSVASSPA